MTATTPTREAPRTPTLSERIRAKWLASKPRVYALVLGLVVGPFISGYLGWQVTSGTAAAQARADVVEQLATICVARARGEAQDTSKLDWSARHSLAERWAIMPGATSSEDGVVTACAQKLAS